MTLHVVQYSGGIGGWAAAQRVATTHGTHDLVLLFADVLVEDPDLYGSSTTPPASSACR